MPIEVGCSFHQCRGRFGWTQTDLANKVFITLWIFVNMWFYLRSNIIIQKDSSIVHSRSSIALLFKLFTSLTSKVLWLGFFFSKTTFLVCFLILLHRWHPLGFETSLLRYPTPRYFQSAKASFLTISEFYLLIEVLGGMLLWLQVMQIVPLPEGLDFAFFFFFPLKQLFEGRIWFFFSSCLFLFYY